MVPNHIRCRENKEQTWREPYKVRPVSMQFFLCQYLQIFDVLVLNLEKRLSIDDFRHVDDPK